MRVYEGKFDFLVSGIGHMVKSLKFCFVDDKEEEYPASLLHIAFTAENFLDRDGRLR